MSHNISQKIVAIGGGKFVPEHTTVRIDGEILNLTGKQHPSILFIPTASDDDEQYCKNVKEIFEEKLGGKVTNLLDLFHNSTTEYSTPST